jgi:hypothetical protein
VSIRKEKKKEILGKVTQAGFYDGPIGKAVDLTGDTLAPQETTEVQENENMEERNGWKNY